MPPQVQENNAEQSRSSATGERAKTDAFLPPYSKSSIEREVAEVTESRANVKEKIVRLSQLYEDTHKLAAEKERRLVAQALASQIAYLSQRDETTPAQGKMEIMDGLPVSALSNEIVLKAASRALVEQNEWLRVHEVPKIIVEGDKTVEGLRLAASCLLSLDPTASSEYARGFQDNVERAEGVLALLSKGELHSIASANLALTYIAAAKQLLFAFMDEKLPKPHENDEKRLDGSFVNPYPDRAFIRAGLEQGSLAVAFIEEYTLFKSRLLIDNAKTMQKELGEKIVPQEAILEMEKILQAIKGRRAGLISNPMDYAAAYERMKEIEGAFSQLMATVERNKLRKGNEGKTRDIGIATIQENTYQDALPWLKIAPDIGALVIAESLKKLGPVSAIVGQVIEKVWFGYRAAENFVETGNLVGSAMFGMALYSGPLGQAFSRGGNLSKAAGAVLKRTGTAAGAVMAYDMGQGMVVSAENMARAGFSHEECSALVQNGVFAIAGLRKPVKLEAKKGADAGKAEKQPDVLAEKETARLEEQLPKKLELRNESYDRLLERITVQKERLSARQMRELRSIEFDVPKEKLRELVELSEISEIASLEVEKQSRHRLGDGGQVRFGENEIALLVKLARENLYALKALQNLAEQGQGFDKADVVEICRMAGSKAEGQAALLVDGDIKTAGDILPRLISAIVQHTPSLFGKEAVEGLQKAAKDNPEYIKPLLAIEKYCREIITAFENDYPRFYSIVASAGKQEGLLGYLKNTALPLDEASARALENLNEAMNQLRRLDRQCVSAITSTVMASPQARALSVEDVLKNSAGYHPEVAEAFGKIDLGRLKEREAHDEVLSQMLEYALGKVGSKKAIGFLKNTAENFPDERKNAGMLIKRIVEIEKRKAQNMEYPRLPELIREFVELGYITKNAEILIGSHMELLKKLMAYPDQVNVAIDALAEGMKRNMDFSIKGNEERIIAAVRGAVGKGEGFLKKKIAEIVEGEVKLPVAVPHADAKYCGVRLIRFEAEATDLNPLQVAKFETRYNDFVSTAADILRGEGWDAAKAGADLQGFLAQVNSIIWSNFEVSRTAHLLHESFTEKLGSALRGGLDCDNYVIVAADILSKFGLDCAAMTMPTHAIAHVKGRGLYFEPVGRGGKMTVAIYNQAAFEKEHPLKLSESEIEPGSVFALWRRAEAHLERGDYLKAASDYENALKQDPKNPRLCFELGTCYQRLAEKSADAGDHASALLQRDAAKRQFSQAIKLYGNTMEDYMGSQAAAAGTMGFKLDRKLFKQANDDFADYYFARADVEVALGQGRNVVLDLSKGNEHLKKTIAVDALADAMAAFKEWGVEACLDLLQKSLALDPSVYKWGVFAKSMKEIMPQLNVLRNKEHLPEHEIAEKFYQKRGHAYFALGNFERAILDYEQALKADPKNPRTENCIGDSYFALRDYKSAAEHYREAIELAKIRDAGVVSYELRMKLGDAYYALDRLVDAIENYDMAHRLYEMQE